MKILQAKKATLALDADKSGALKSDFTITKYSFRA